ncbi:cyclic AMP-dependent transcription factor ATF-1-like [Limulus polyphemus]|uniref:Cyclic AMP-dependent transcription factor ATF-1-like n=1 Tax=Limulus polyphemus TaxID=6850 RepID=A0ABM1BQV1_LIMPO|nr:cyclic AMP-dependent transcription factor ATF-1-like [Limulus polyphemus]XP_013786892.1 cyclic AMP-dependent transcription factor ATF-1-like [Limulus polyphemus]XP_022255209.1 cyclic AMP-dependent transcription factor ATF-1-like [Limulus polyphemus]XP_022255210.1 cyclic AMP-dependent transcription factor ATF-1-like [Limulus polyphemus]XP_022255211.1 cyclic AMP-dependent transcription factor ATF-1-like [Limulus polyphemus]
MPALGGETISVKSENQHVEKNNQKTITNSNHYQARSLTVAGTQYNVPPGVLKVVPGSVIQLASSSHEDGLEEVQTITMPASEIDATGTVLQYTLGPDGQFFVQAPVSGEGFETYQFSTETSGQTTELQQSVIMATPSIVQPQEHLGGMSQKREKRLLKNREAAKECRRKKKEYIKCLENRIAVLENQNEALIEELKTLKQLYC